MEYLNKVELVGTIGSVRTSEVGGGLAKVLSMSVATSTVYNDKDNNNALVVATEWHRVTAWEDNKITDVEAFKKGMNVRVEGRLRTRKYTDSDGVEKYQTEIVAKSIEILEEHQLSLPR